MPSAHKFWEANAWDSVGAGWTPLFGYFKTKGVSFEWHDFESEREVDWGKSFHPYSAEICLNLSGNGVVAIGSQQVRFSGACAGFYRQTDPAAGLRANRAPGRHQFLTVEYSDEFLQRQFRDYSPELHPLVARIVRGDGNQNGIGTPEPLRSEQEQLIQALHKPPVNSGARPVWFESKALELAASFFFRREAEQDLFCDRQKRLARERCEQVIALLRADLANPPGLEELGRRVGASHFYLSRTFSKKMGMTIAQYLRRLRMERAAQLLKSGEFNVTQAALEVGYSSLSHFSQVFHDTYGCCPGLYAIAPNHIEG